MNQKTKPLEEMSKALLAAPLLLLSILGFASAPLMTDPVPGGIAKIKVPFPSAKMPLAFFENTRVAMKKVGDDWYAIVGLPLQLKGYTHNLFLKTPKLLRIKFLTDFYDYKIQHLSINNQGLVDLDDVNKSRDRLDKESLNQAFATWQDDSPFNKRYQAPLQGWISSEFGLRRLINNKKVPSHNGLDIAAKLETPIKATADGTVVFSDELLITGKTIVINHGQGLMSLYAHLNKMDVPVGKKVNGGEQIGLVGKSGRTTGPHLHFAFILNGYYVNPFFFIAKQNFRPKK